MIRTAPCIPVFFACDDKFAKYTAVSLFSLIKNEPQDTTYTYKIHILNTGLSEVPGRSSPS